MRATGVGCRCGAVSRAPRHCVRRNIEVTVRAGGDQAEPQPAFAVPLSRRQLEMLLVAAAAAMLASPGPAQAVGFKKELKKRKVPIEEYGELPNGLKYYDLAAGSGLEARPGLSATVHFDCIYRGIDVVSSRAARLLGGNRTIAEPLEFVVGQRVSSGATKLTGDSAGGLFSGASGPKPPPALSTAVIGMKVGGKRSVIVPPELGYGARGELEIGPDTAFELRIELLAVAS